MKAVILAGGLNINSLEPIANNHLRSMLPVLNKPLLEHSISFLKSHGIDEIIICLNGGAKQIRDHFGNGEEWGVNIHYLEEKHPNGTAGCLLKAGKILNDTFVVMDSTVVPDFDFSGFVKFHAAKNSIATIGVHKINNETWMPLERIHLDTNQEISGVTILHPSEDKRSRLCTAGVYIFEPRVLDSIPPQGYFDLKEQLLPSLIQANLHPHAWVVDGYCGRISTAYDYWKINQDILRLNSNPIRGEKICDGVWAEGPYNISKTANLIGPVIIGRNCTIDNYCQIVGPIVIGDNCHIAGKAIVQESVILENCNIPEGSVIKKTIYTGNGNISLKDGPIANGGYDLYCYRDFSPCGLRKRKLFPLRRQIQHFLKRLLDIIGSIVGLLIFLPLFPVIGLAIKLDSPGPIFFRQARCGKNGKTFHMIKFRSMITDAERLKERLRMQNQADGPTFKIDTDPRITRVGKIIRQLYLDELPQMFNVLKGEMSLVGPRPLVMEEMRFNPAWRDARLTVKPGLTGPWQISEDRNSFYKWIEEDTAYVRNWSISRDFKVLMKTALWFLRSIPGYFKPEGHEKRGHRITQI
ncbi:MAG: sugar transferase [Thermodesulfobacteriota bacterium]